MGFLSLLGIDWYYIVLVVPALILSMVASSMVKSRFAAYDRVLSKRGLSGAQAASLLLQASGITDVEVTHISGKLTDNYNSGDKTLNLSDATYSSTSIAAVGVAAHETGHAIQHHLGYGPLALRASLYPVANIGSRFGPTLAIVGILFGAASANGGSYPVLAGLLVKAGICLYAAAVSFYVVTLPVEFDASRRALVILRERGLLDAEELQGARKVLSAAALTYVAAALSAIGNLLRLVLIARREQRRR